MTSTLSLAVSDLSASQRETLAEWQTQLTKLVAHQRTCRHRSAMGDLGRHLASAIRGAGEAIGEVSASPANQLLAGAAESIALYFEHTGDARTAASQFPAFLALRGFLRGCKVAETLAGLGDQAEATADLIARLLAGQVVWQFQGLDTK